MYHNDKLKFKKEKVAIFKINIFLYISIAQNFRDFLISIFRLFSVSFFFFSLPIIKVSLLLLLLLLLLLPYLLYKIYYIKYIILVTYITTTCRTRRYTTNMITRYIRSGRG